MQSCGVDVVQDAAGIFGYSLESADFPDEMTFP